MPLEKTIQDMMVWIVSNEGDPGSPHAKEKVKADLKQKRSVMRKIRLQEYKEKLTLKK